MHTKLYVKINYILQLYSRKNLNIIVNYKIIKLLILLGQYLSIPHIIKICNKYESAIMATS